MIDPLVKKIADHYGLIHQAGKLCEECGELIAESQRIALGDLSEIRKKCFAGEVADVIIMTQQMIHLLGIEKLVSKRIDEKVARQIRRINSNKFGRADDV